MFSTWVLPTKQSDDCDYDDDEEEDDDNEVVVDDDDDCDDYDGVGWCGRLLLWTFSLSKHPLLLLKQVDIGHKTTGFAARRWPWCFRGTIIVIHKINVSILRGKTHMIMTFSHPNMTCVSEKRSFHESRKLIFLNIKRGFRASPGMKYVPKQLIA